MPGTVKGLFTEYAAIFDEVVKCPRRLATTVRVTNSSAEDRSASFWATSARESRVKRAVSSQPRPYGINTGYNSDMTGSHEVVGSIPTRSTSLPSIAEWLPSAEPT
jgi:hypothetical protein